MSRVQGSLAGGGLVPSPLRIGPFVPGGRATTYMQPVQIARQVFTNVAAASANAYLLAKTGAALPGAAGSVTFTPDGALGTGLVPQPRNVVVTITHSSAVVACNGVISGFDEYGNAITEAWSAAAGTTSRVFTGVRAFARVTSITFVTAANAQANTITVGTGNTLGLQFALTDAGGAFREISAGTVVTNGVFVAANPSPTTDIRGTYTPNTVPNGSTTYIVYYLVADPSIGL